MSVIKLTLLYSVLATYFKLAVTTGAEVVCPYIIFLQHDFLQHNFLQHNLCSYDYTYCILLLWPYVSVVLVTNVYYYCRFIIVCYSVCMDI